MKRIRRSVLLLALIAAVVTQTPTPALASTGGLDPSFGDAGALRLDLPGEGVVLSTVLVQPDGKILVGGKSFARDDSTGEQESADGAFIARLERDGRMDTLFGDGGAVRLDLDVYGAFVDDLALQPDGRIVASGGKGDYNDRRTVLIRLLPSGVLDPTFGVNGVASDALPYASELRDLSILSDGTIVAALGGYTSRFRVARFRPDGDLDESFGDDGVASTPLDGYDSTAFAAPLQNGRIIAGGTNENTHSKFALARFDAAGQLDQCFGLDGRAKSGAGMVEGRYDELFASTMVVQPDGRFVVGGAFDPKDTANTRDFAIGRYNADGSTDATFGTNGGTRVDLGLDYEQIDRLLLQSDGKIVAVGHRPYTAMRFLPDGTLDDSFGTEGATRFNFTEDGFWEATDAAMDADGNIVMVGTAPRGPGTTSHTGAGLVRLLGDGEPAADSLPAADITPCTPADASSMDFVGDGSNNDAVIGAPDEDYPGLTDAGAIINVSTRNVIHQDTALIPGTRETGDRFGASMAAGDFDADGLDDLAVGSPDEDISAIRDAGSVTAIYGLGVARSPYSYGSARPAQLFHQDAVGVEGLSEPGDRFGASLAGGDFNGDGFDDLAIGAPFEDVSSKVDAGAVNVLFGSPEGLTPVSDKVITQTPGRPEARDLFGSVLAAGRFTSDRFDDLAVGVPGESVGTAARAGAINLLNGSGTGPNLASGRVLHQNSPGVPGVSEAGDVCGWSLSAGDYDRDGDFELATGCPGEDLGAVFDAGGVEVFEGTAQGPTTADTEFVVQLAPIEVPEASDNFGWALTSNDINGDAYDDLAVGVPGESIGTISRAGAAEVHYGSSTGIDPARRQLLHQGSNPELGEPQTGDMFGVSMLAVRASVDAVSELYVGAPYDHAHGVDGAGSVMTYSGTAAGADDRDGVRPLDQSVVAWTPSYDADADLGVGDHFGLTFPTVGR